MRASPPRRIPTATASAASIRSRTSLAARIPGACMSRTRRTPMKMVFSSWGSTARSRWIPARLICSCRCTSSQTHRCATRCLPPSSRVRRIPAAPTSCPTGRSLSGWFRTFYEDSGLYTVTTSDKGFTLVPRGGSQELMFQFDEQDTNGQFMITVPQAAEPQPLLPLS